MLNEHPYKPTFSCVLAVKSFMRRCIDNKAQIEGLKVEFLSSKHRSSETIVHKAVITTKKCYFVDLIIMVLSTFV